MHIVALITITATFQMNYIIPMLWEDINKSNIMNKIKDNPLYINLKLLSNNRFIISILYHIIILQRANTVIQIEIIISHKKMISLWRMITIMHHNHNSVK